MKKNNHKYELVRISYLEDLKCEVIIRLTEKVSEEILEQQAKEIYKELKKAKKFKKVFMGWFLPGMELDAGAWATTNFNPELKVKIMEYMLSVNPARL